MGPSLAFPSTGGVPVSRHTLGRDRGPCGSPPFQVRRVRAPITGEDARRLSLGCYAPAGGCQQPRGCQDFSAAFTTMRISPSGSTPRSDPTRATMVLRTMLWGKAVSSTGSARGILSGSDVPCSPLRRTSVHAGRSRRQITSVRFHGAGRPTAARPRMARGLHAHRAPRLAGLQAGGRRIVAEALIGELARQGLRVASIKSMMHGAVPPEPEGADTRRHLAAGAEATLAFSAEEDAVFARRSPSSPRDRLERWLPPGDRLGRRAKGSCRAFRQTA